MNNQTNKIVEIMSTSSTTQAKKKVINYNGKRFIYDSSNIEAIGGNLARFIFKLNGNVVLKFDDEV